MTWVRRTDPRTAHRCPAPQSGSFRSPVGQHGDLWRCHECGQLWRVGAACDMCDRYGDIPHRGGHAVGHAWRPASLLQRLVNWRKGRT